MTAAEADGGPAAAFAALDRAHPDSLRRSTYRTRAGSSGAGVLAQPLLGAGIVIGLPVKALIARDPPWAVLPSALTTRTTARHIRPHP